MILGDFIQRRTPIQAMSAGIFLILMLAFASDNGEAVLFDGSAPQLVAQDGSMLILLPANTSVSVQWMNELGEPQGSPVALATANDLSEGLASLRSELLASINANTAAIASDRSTTTALLNDKASNTDVLNVQQEASLATSQTNIQASTAVHNFHFIQLNKKNPPFITPFIPLRQVILN